ncbi:MAG: TlpA family protein disulfide reductase [Deltaproteobacteria bacterium]|nr:TlpA family protein disulfide reductase [Deltaproteobacteria bacterium]
MPIKSSARRRQLLMPLISSLCAAALGCFVNVPALAADMLHDFSAFNFIDNSEINTSEMRGSIMVLVFGSIYCKPCIELLPIMNTLHERYYYGDVRVICLDIDLAVDPALQREFVNRHAIKPPYIINALQIARNNRVFMLPTTLIVNREGEIVKRIYGFKKIRAFESALKKLCPVTEQPSIAAQPDPEHEPAHQHESHR